MSYEEVRYEGYGINGAAVIVDCMTDNRTRTVADVRHAFSKYGGNLGTDGSVAFRAPPGMALHFQLLDEQYRALQTMRSFVGLMPGESRGCLGCHEGHSRTPQVEDRRAWR